MIQNTAGWIGTLLFCLALCSTCRQKEPEIKPNLLFILTDEQTYFTMKAYGNDRIQTPNLNRLTETSFVFEKAYVTQPVCTPNRASVLTGLYPHSHGSTTNNIALDESLQTLPELFSDTSYHTAYIGKWHLGDEVFAQHGFDTWISIEDLYSNHYRDGRDPEARSDYHHWLIANGYEPDRPDGKFSRQFAAKLPIEHGKPAFIKERALAYVESHQTNPFILFLSYLEPHMPFFGPLDSLYHPEDILLPESYHHEMGADVPLKYRLKSETIAGKYGETEADMRQLIANYWGLVSLVDLSIGAILDKLDTLGLAENTIVVFTSDHGDMMGAHRLVEKQVMYEESVRVPLIIRDLRLGRQQMNIDQPVSHIDIVPTLLDLMDQPIPAHLQGRSVRPVMQGEPNSERPVFIEWNPDRNPRSGMPKVTNLASDEKMIEVNQSYVRTIVTPNGWKLALHTTDISQLFHLPSDPLELHNLFGEAAYRDTVEQLMKEIINWQIATSDTIDIQVKQRSKNKFDTLGLGGN